MTARLITPPAALAVDLALARDCLRVDGTDQDAQIRSLILGITMQAEHLTGRAFVHQDWRVTLDAFPAAIRLDRAPLAQVLSLRYYDTNNVLQTLHPDDYEADAVTEPGYVVPAVGKAWPSTFSRINAVMVDYRCGYGADHTAVPENIKAYILGVLAVRFDPPPTGAQDAIDNLSGLLDASMVYG